MRHLLKRTIVAKAAWDTDGHEADPHAPGMGSVVFGTTLHAPVMVYGGKVMSVTKVMDLRTGEHVNPERMITCTFHKGRLILDSKCQQTPWLRLPAWNIREVRGITLWKVGSQPRNITGEATSVPV